MNKIAQAIFFITLVPLFSSMLFGFEVSDFENIYFLHHSTGNGVYTYPDKGVPTWFSEYNAAHSTNFQISHRYYPNTPYPWANYPYDYWNLWINGACDNGDPDIVCMDNLVQNYDVIIYKHCYPGSDILADTGSPDISSDRKSLENYKLQYRALRDLMDKYPDTIFILWTLPPRRESETNAANAARATQFSEWVKNEFLTEDGKSHPNIYIFDYRSITVGPDNFLADEYVGDSSSHPNDAGNNAAGPLFAQFIVDSIYDFVNNKSASRNVVDHYNLADFDTLSQEQTDKVRDLNWYFGHQSTGRIMMYGLDSLETQNPSLYGINIVPESGV